MAVPYTSASTFVRSSVPAVRLKTPATGRRVGARDPIFTFSLPMASDTRSAADSARWKASMTRLVVESRMERLNVLSVLWDTTTR